MQTIANVSCQLTSIELLESVINSARHTLEDLPIYQFDIQIEHRTQVDKGILFALCSIIVLSEDKNYEYGSIKTNCVFQLDDLSRFVNPELKQVKLPEQLTVIINSITISTSRGVMFANFRGTHLHNAVLPILDPKVFGR